MKKKIVALGLVVTLSVSSYDVCSNGGNAWRRMRKQIK